MASVGTVDLKTVPFEPSDAVRKLLSERSGRPVRTGADDLLSAHRRPPTSLLELRVAIPHNAPGARVAAVHHPHHHQ